MEQLRVHDTCTDTHTHTHKHTKTVPKLLLLDGHVLTRTSTQKLSRCCGADIQNWDCVIQHALPRNSATLGWSARPHMAACSDAQKTTNAMHN
eukprot:COSAG02_NODE_7565_length_2958_cov_11.960476_4_plen_93_part_00